MQSFSYGPCTAGNRDYNSFHKKTWANKLKLQHKMYSLILKDGDSTHNIIMDRNFDGVIEDPDNYVVHLLASLPDPYSIKRY